MIHLKDKETSLLEVPTRLLLGSDASVTLVQFEYVWRKHEHCWVFTTRRRSTGWYKAIAVQDITVWRLICMSKRLFSPKRHFVITRAIRRKTKPVAQKKRGCTDELTERVV